MLKMEADKEILNLKPITAEMNILSRSDGSVIITQGDSSCIVNVNGPSETVSMANMDMNKAYMEVSYRPRCGIPGVNERYKEKIIKNICETVILTALYPKSQINIQIQEMDDGSGIFACVINACNVALLNSGIEMRSTMAAVHCVLDDKDNLIIDPIDYSDDTPTFSRIQKAVRNSKYKADFTFVFESIKESVISVNTNGTFTIHQYNNAQKLCKEASKKIFEFYCDLARKYANVI